MLLATKKIVTTPLKFLSAANFKEAQHPRSEFEYAVYIGQNKAVNCLQISFREQRLIIVLALVIPYYFEKLV